METQLGIEQEGGTTIAVTGEITDTSQVRNLIHIAEQHFGHLDVVVLSAADVRHATVLDTSEDLFDAIFAANARGAFLPRRESALRLRYGGRLVAISAGPEVMEAEVAKTPPETFGAPAGHR